jgi:hypothetical protein
MASKVPTIKQVAWISIIPQFSFIGVLILIYSKLGLELLEVIFCSSLTYLVISFSLRTLLTKNFRQGIKLVKQQDFSSAIPFFEKSVNFFTKNRWIDKYRFITLLSSSKISYKEMGLCNIAFCYSQTGNGVKAKEYYERTLDEFPNSVIASTALKFINSIECK